MEQDNTHIEDFLRKKLAENGGAEAGWDRPDPEVWEGAQAALLESPSSKRWTLQNGLLAALLLLLFLLGGYALKLQTEVVSLKNKKPVIGLKELAEKATAEKIAAQTIALQQDSIKLLMAQLAQKEVVQETTRESNMEQAKLIRRMQVLRDRNQSLQTQLRQLKATTASNQVNSPVEKADNSIAYQTEINRLGKALDKQLTENVKLQQALADSDQLRKDALSQVSNNIINEKVEEKSAEDSLEIVKITPVPKLDKPMNYEHGPRLSPASRWEIGYEAAGMAVKTPVHRDFDHQRPILPKTYEKEFFAVSHGMMLGYSPLPRLWIRTGLRQGFAKSETNYETGLEYDKSNEYTLANGQTGNEIFLNTKTPYTETRSRIDVALPRDVDFVTGDLLELEVKETEVSRLYQVPLSLEYFYGKRKLQAVLQAGSQYNRYYVKEYYLDAELNGRGRELEVKKTEAFDKDIPAKQYMSGLAGLGLNYSLTPKWQVRGQVNYQYDFVNNKSSEIKDITPPLRALRLSLHYRF